MEAKLLAVRGGAITAVDAAGSARTVGLQPGDSLISINGNLLRDAIDCQFYAEGTVTLAVERGGERFTVTLEVDAAGLGLEFATPTFDGIRRCANNCPFCFLKGLPPGQRPGLYVKDDDYRYSFLFGNFVTLTNLQAADWDRLAEQRLSPLYVSVHATDPVLRRQLLGNPRAPDVLEQIRRLAALKVRVHTQVVLVPGLNDGSQLDRTIGDLAALHPAVQSIGVVPVGLTRYHPGAAATAALAAGTALRRYTAAEARAVVAAVEGWARRLRPRLGVSLVYSGDELYLLSRRRIPAAPRYDGFPQYENGIGMVRVLLEDWFKLRRRLARGAHRFPAGRVRLVSGMLAAPTLAAIVADLNRLAGTNLEVWPVPNRFFGADVTVAGLLTGSDVLAALEGSQRPDLLVLPRSMLDAAGERFLDDGTPAALAQATGTRVAAAELLSEIVAQG